MARRRMNRSRTLLLGVTAVVGGVGSIGATAEVRAEGPVPATAAIGPLVEVADVGSSPSISGDGRFVVFVSAPPAADGRASTVSLRDRSTGTTTELTVPSASTPLGDSVRPVISDDGCVVAVVTQMAYDVFRDDNRLARWDVYRTVLPGCEGTPGWELVSTTGTSARGDVDATVRPAISASGAVIAYTRLHTGVPQPTEGPLVTAVDVVDLTVPLGDPARTQPAAGMPVEAPRTTYRYRGQSQPSVSADGRHVAFVSDTTANDVLPSWGAGPAAGGFATTNVFVWDREAQTPATAVRLVSAGATPAEGSTAGATPANGSSSDPALSADGRVVAFSSTATNFVDGVVLPPCADVCPAQVYALDRDPDDDGTFDADPPAARLTLVSRDPAAAADATTAVVAGAGSSIQPALSSDGSLIAFVTQASNLLPIRSVGGGSVGQGEIVVAERLTGRLRRASVASDGLTPAAALSARPDLSETGRVVVFDTAAPQLVGGGAEGRRIVSVTTAPTASMAALDLGTVAPGYVSEEWYTSVVNEGPTSFLPSTAVSTNPEFEVTGGTCLTGGSVPPGGSCTVTMTFSPTAGGPRDSVVTVAEEGFGALSIAAEVRGAGGEPALVGEPNGYDFGDPVVGTPGGSTAIGVKNVGLAPAVIGAVTIQGLNPDDFTITDDRCGRRTLNPGGSCAVEVSFTPAAAGHRSATLVVATTVADQYTGVVLGGAGHYEPQLAVPEPIVQAGSMLTVGGSGFPAQTPVNVTWADGIGPTVVVTTDPEGSFQLALPVPRGERAGDRVLVAAVSADLSAATPVRVVRTGSRGPASANWPGR